MERLAEQRRQRITPVINNEVPTPPSTQRGWYGLGSLKPILQERALRIQSEQGVKGRSLLGLTRRISLGVSPNHYRYFCALQLHKTCLNKWALQYKGLENIPRDRPVLFVMKHRGFSDITLHGFGYAWASSGLHLSEAKPWEKNELTEDILSAGKMCRFVMKEDLLNLPIGIHLVFNGGIPVPQDLETKALNTPGFDPKDPNVLAQQKKMSSWFNFKDSYREILNTLKDNNAVMIYGEATRVAGDQMGHLSLKMIQRLAKVPKTQLIPVGTTLDAQGMCVSYGAPCALEELRDQIAKLSNIPKDRYL